MVVFILGLGAASLGSASCDDGDAPDAPDADPSCHIDCVPATSCVDGVVRQERQYPVPCSEWTGECPSDEIAWCQHGCAFEPSFLRFSDFESNGSALCAGTPAAVAGQACGRDEDCLPTVAVAQPDGTVTQTYLRCEAGGCVADEPTPPWTEDCGVCESRRGTGFRGVIATEEPGYLCVVADDPVAGCFETRVTNYCTGDWQCGAGDSCEVFPDLVIPNANGGVCRPGARGTPITVDGC